MSRDEMSSDPACVLVAGAAGFVGSRIVGKLHADGIRVLAGVRKSRDKFKRLGVEQRVFDTTDGVAAQKALEGVTHVVNCVMGPAPAMIASTRALLDAARSAGSTRYVEFSSIAVFGDAAGKIADDHKQGRNIDAYGEAKIACETLVREASSGGMEVVILRPALIYGPGSEQWSARIGRLLRAGRLGDLGAEGDGIANLVHIEDVVAAATAALFAPGIAGRAFNLALPAAPTWNRYLMDYARALGAVPVRRIPARNLKLETKLVAIPLKIAEIVTGKLRFGGALVPDPVTPGLGRLFSLDARYHSPAADQILGHQTKSYVEGLAESAAWLLSERQR